MPRQRISEEEEVFELVGCDRTNVSSLEILDGDEEIYYNDDDNEGEEINQNTFVFRSLCVMAFAAFVGLSFFISILRFQIANGNDSHHSSNDYYGSNTNEQDDDDAVIKDSSSYSSNSEQYSSSSSSTPTSSYVTEYDLIPTNIGDPYKFTPMDFEIAMKKTGITQEEYINCNTSIYQYPNRTICIEAIYTDEASCHEKQEENMNRDLKEERNENDNNENHRISCSKEVSQWTTKCSSDWDGESLKARWGSTCSNDIPIAPYSNNNIYSNDDAITITPWKGGPIPSNLADVLLLRTEPYEGQFCLQKAALNALSRQGWELIEPQNAFTASVWKVIKRTPV